MGEAQSHCEFITIEKTHPLNDQVWKVIKLVLPNMAAVFEKSSKSRWVLEGVVLSTKDYCIKEVTMLSISKFANKMCTKQRRLEIDFREHQIYLLDFEVDPIQAQFPHQLVKKSNLIEITKLKCKCKKETIALLESCILKNNY